jgi:hypothetical protein
MSRGIAMMESLLNNSAISHLYIFAFDDDCFSYLKDKITLSKVSIVSLEDFETKELLEIKATRTPVEYCWTCTPSIIKYCILNFNLPNCTYLDADLIFYSDPSSLIKEMGCQSVLITPHNYTTKYDQSKTSGKYCVQFVTFKNTVQGMVVLEEWTNQCIEWCYARFEDNKFGDQKYLDSWPERHACVHVLDNHSAGVAPWNLQQYEIAMKNNRPVIIDNDGNQKELVFFHFHYFKNMFMNRLFSVGGYDTKTDFVNIIYSPYAKRISVLNSVINKYHGNVFAKISEYNIYIMIKYLVKYGINYKGYRKIIINTGRRLWQK